MSTFEPIISRGTKSLVRKRPELQAPFRERRAIMDAKRQERERLRQAAQVGVAGYVGGWDGEPLDRGETCKATFGLSHARHVGYAEHCWVPFSEFGSLVRSLAPARTPAFPPHPFVMPRRPVGMPLDTIGRGGNAVVLPYHRSANRGAPSTAHAAEAGGNGGGEGEEDGGHRRPTPKVRAGKIRK